MSYKVKMGDMTFYYYKDPAHLIIHRDDGPAIEYKNGSKEWWRDGKRHRADGPAVEFVNGENSYWYNNTNYPEIMNNDQWLNFVKLFG